MKLVLLAALVVGLALLVVTYEVIRLVPLVELRRRARADRHFHNLYQAASFGPALELVLALLISGGGLVLVIWAYKTAWWLALVVVWAGLLASRLSLPAWSWRLAALVVPPLVWLLSLIRPAVRPLERLWPARQPHSRLYEKEDVLELLERQKIQADSRLSEAELKLARGALQFSEKKVSDIMTPKRQLKLVAATDPIGPHLMDELHSSGQLRFLVIKDATKTGKDEIVGTLNLQDLAGRTAGGKVRQVMHRPVERLKETADLRQALSKFLKTGQHLLIVINNFEELVGALAIEQVLDQIFGEPLSDEAADLPAANQPPEKADGQELEPNDS